MNLLRALATVSSLTLVSRILGYIRDFIIARAFGATEEGEHDFGGLAGDDGGVVEPCISYLRRKADQGEPRLIHTIRGVGYMLRVPPP